MSIDFLAPMPEWILFGLISLLVVNEILFPWERSHQKTMLPVLVILGMVTSVVWMPEQGTVREAFYGMYRHDAFAAFFKVFFVFTASVVCLLSVDYLASNNRSVVTFFMILMCAVLGLFVLVSSANFILLFLALEIVTMSFYILASYVKKELIAIEAALKYLILGSVASALTVYGISLVSQSAGTFAFDGVYRYGLVNFQNPVYKLGILFIISGICFKVAAAPFHLWVPDVYQGAPTPVTAFLAVGSKAAGFAVLIRILSQAFPLSDPHRTLLFGTFAIMTLVYGNLGALRQKNIKRLMGYSSIGHAGYLLIAVAVFDAFSLASLLYYLIAYSITTLTIFYLISLVESKTGSSDFEVYRGLGRRSPFVAGALFVAMLSSAGIPPLAGFAGKFLVLLGAVKSGAWLFALAGVLFVPVALYYYLHIVSVMYFEKDTARPPEYDMWDNRLTRFFLILLCLGILFLGIYVGVFFPDAQKAVLSL